MNVCTGGSDHWDVIYAARNILVRKFDVYQIGGWR